MYVYFVAKDNRPLSIGSNAGFQQFIRCFDPDWVCPCPRTIDNKIDEMYPIALSKVRDIIFNCSSYSITFDLWTNSRSVTFGGIIAHLIMGNKKRTLVLAFSEFEGPHDAENLRGYVERTLNELKLPTFNLFSITTDNVSAMMAAFRYEIRSHVFL